MTPSLPEEGCGYWSLFSVLTLPSAYLRMLLKRYGCVLLTEEKTSTSYQLA